jgi:uncharacterized protein (DUF924 family)
MSSHANEQHIDPSAERVLRFWFGTTDEDGMSADEVAGRWFGKAAAFDEAIVEQFGEEHAAVMRGERDGWLASARGRLAYLIVLDQMSRNMFRDTPGMFASDELALAAAMEGIDRGMDRTLSGDLRAFYYLPLMHSERLEVQQRCVELFRSFTEESEGRARERMANSLKYAIAHRDIVAKWGRFPHRNAILGRESTAEEKAFLEQPGSSF